MNVASIQDLENKKISKLLWQYALPAIVGVIVNMLYNIIDAVFIGHWVGKDAIVALGVVFPVMNLTAAFGMLVGSGAASRISIYLGLRDKDMAEKIAGTSFLMSLILSGTVIVLLLIFLEPVLRAAGANDATYPYARDFMVIFLPGNLFLSMCFNFNSMMRASGYPKKAMFTMLIGVVANIILAPLFIRGFDMGMKGAATATFISMVISFAFVMHHFLDKNSYIKLKVSNMRLKMNIIKPIASIGLSPFFIQIAASVVIVFINHQLNAYGDGSSDAIGGYIIVNRVVMLILMIIIGLTQGMQPIVGYNFGAKKYERVKETLIYTIKVGVCISSVGFVLGLAIPHLLVSAFSNDEALTNLATEAFRIIVLAFPLVGFQIVVTNFFQSVGMAGKAIFLSLTRQILLLIPCLYILPHSLGLRGVWYSFPLADTLSFIITLLMFLAQVKTFKRLEKEQQATLQ